MVLQLALGALVLASTIVGDSLSVKGSIPESRLLRHTSRAPLSSGYLPPSLPHLSPGSHHPEFDVEHPGSSSQDKRPYSYEYHVHDDSEGTHFGHKESGKGNSANGEYYVRLPDGRLQTVTYYTDDKGFHPDIAYNGTDGRGKALLHDGSNGSGGGVSSSKSLAPQQGLREPRVTTHTSPTSTNRRRQRGRFSGPVKIVKRIRGPISRKEFENLRSRNSKSLHDGSSGQQKSLVFDEPSYSDRIAAGLDSHDLLYVPESIYTDTLPDFEAEKTSPSIPSAKTISHTANEPTVKSPDLAYGLPEVPYKVEYSPSLAYGLPEVSSKTVEAPVLAYGLPEVSSKTVEAPVLAYGLPKITPHTLEAPSSLYGLPETKYETLETPLSGYGFPKSTRRTLNPLFKATGRTLVLPETQYPGTEVPHIEDALDSSTESTEVPTELQTTPHDEEDIPIHFNKDIHFDFSDTLFRNVVEATDLKRPRPDIV